MSFFGRLFERGRAAQAARDPQSHLASGHSQPVGTPASTNATRRELLRVVLRDTLTRHGIPSTWVGAEALVSTTREGQKGVHWRLVVKHWEPRLMIHGVALQQSLIKRVTHFDPLAPNWLMGISWQFALADESVCPPMPPPGVWTSDAPLAVAPPAALPVAPGGVGDVIAGPVRIGASQSPQNPQEEARADLEQLFAARDADFRRNAGQEGEPGYDATQPSYLATQPAKL